MGRRIKITARIIGGLGNQLFSYAAARRLAMMNGAELRTDSVSGFLKDRYGRKFALHHFNIPQNVVPSRTLCTNSRYYRGFLKLVSKQLPFGRGPFLVENGNDYDRRMVDLRLRRSIYMEGYWQSENYFKDIEPQIREDLRFISTPTPEATALSREMQTGEAVAVHVRRLQISKPLQVAYYRRACEFMVEKLRSPRFYIFSDCPGWAEANFDPHAPVMHVNVAGDDGTGWQDLWLMSQCSHFIIANSTFSWWGAWLCRNSGKIVVYPSFFANWGHAGLVPKSWIPVQSH
ncbi:MAG: alpha-1,2-fucosyltransferase [Syntrophobacteraceae bacterium]